MSKEIKVILIENEPKLKFQINSDDVKKGDFFYIQTDNEKELAQLTQAIELQLTNDLRQKLTSEIIDKYKKENPEYKGLLESIDKYKNDLNENKNLLTQKDGELKNAELSAFEKFRKSDEYLKLQKEINDLKQQNADNTALVKEKDAKISGLKAEAIEEFRKSDEFRKLLQELEQQKEINNQNNTKIQVHAQELKTTRIEAVEQFKKTEEYTKIVAENSKLSKELSKLEQETVNMEQNFQLKFDSEIANQKLALTNENIELKNKIDQLERSRGNNSKLIGEELERYVSEEILRDGFDMMSGIKYEKTTKAINGKKPDFYFEVQSKQKEELVLGSVVIEVKAQSTSGKTKNSEHFEKLEMDRINFNGDFSLLITELEPELDFSITFDSEYPKMIIVRPAYAKSVLKLIAASLWARENELIDQNEFKSNKEIVAEFEELKNTLLQKELRFLREKANSILDKATKIISTAEKIQEEAEAQINRYIENAAKRLQKFSFKKADVNDQIEIDED
ncbi:DUF2130 domain-containing protein [Mycoplasma procyoni]|uniref:DUF2130 domain-containing protein n=1 Tax=Mycoplasma procyoni TaxID=568784 RepID=UPI00197CB05D|nr:DUF2130 domain-containing protein [Mycoplasma procyoni]MBN3534553.1 DUF2130 domain-containing protein [Mycoplasma procyoni]